jgi:hypothetical protein
MTFKAGQSANLNGWPKGSKNKQTLTAIDRLEALGCDPIEGMARIFMDEAADLSIRAQMYKELAHYMYLSARRLGDGLRRIAIAICRRSRRSVVYCTESRGGLAYQAAC